MTPATNVGKLATVLTYLVANAPRPIGRTMLQKLVYLADVARFDASGTTISGLPYVAFDHGPWLPELYAALTLAPEILEKRYFWHKGSGFEYQLDKSIPPDFTSLAPDERQVLDATLMRWARRPLADVLAHVYSEAPYKGTPFGEQVDFTKLRRRSG